MRKLITQFCNFIFGKHKNNTLPRVWILAADMVIVIVSYFIAIIMLYFQDIKASSFDWSRIWIVPITYLIAFLLTRTVPTTVCYAMQDLTTSEKYLPLARVRYQFSSSANLS